MATPTGTPSNPAASAPRGAPVPVPTAPPGFNSGLAPEFSNIPSSPTSGSSPPKTDSNYLTDASQVGAFLAAIKQHESGGNYTAYNAGGGASGAYQYIFSTWKSEATAAGFGQYADEPAANAPPSIQDAVAAYNAKQLFKAYGNWKDAAEAWYYPAWAGKAQYQNQVPYPSAGNTLTIGAYGDNIIGSMAKSLGQPAPTGSSTPGSTSTSGVDTSGLGTADPAQAAQDAAQISLDYKWMEQLSPELKQIINDDLANGVPEAQVTSDVMQSDWFRNNSDSMRKWIQATFEDPATAYANVNQKMQDIQAQAQTLGLNLSGQQLTNLAVGDLSGGWDTQQLLNNVLSNSTYQQAEQASQSGQGTGNIESMMAAIKQQAAQYMIPMSDEAAYNWAVKMIQEGVAPGSSTNDGGLTAQLQEQASSRFPSLASQISAGVTPSQYFDSYKQQTANLLEVSPDQVDLMNNPTYAKMTDIVDPNGVRRPMTLTEAATYVRGLPQWQTTTNAMQQAGQLTTSILNTFGAIKQ